MLKSLYATKRVSRTQAELNAVLAQHERFVDNRGGLRAQLSGTDLSGLNLARRNLAEADFSGAKLVGARLYLSNLERASLYCSDLQLCDLRHANLQHADIRGSSLKGANLSFAHMDHADLRAAMMMYISSDAAPSVRSADTDRIHGVDFSNCSMKNVSFGNAKLDGAVFDGALLQGANFRGARLSNVSFRDAVLTGVNLDELAVPPEALEGSICDVGPEALARCNVLRAQLDAHQEWIVSGGRRGSQCILDGEDLRPLKDVLVSRGLSAISARNAMAIGVNFAGCQLQAACFDGADLRDADFSGADLRGASLRNAKLAHARFDGADLRNLPLENGHTRSADLSMAIAIGEQFANTRLDAEVSMLGLAPSAGI